MSQFAFAVLLQYLARARRREFDANLASLGLSDAVAIKGPSLVRLLGQLCNAGLVTRHEDRLGRNPLPPAQSPSIRSAS